MLKKLLDLIKREPALFISLAAGVLTLLAAFGLNVGDQRQAAIMAVIQLLVGIVVRSQVTPV